MKYLGIARIRKGRVHLPDSFPMEDGRQYDVVELGGDILLIPSMLDKNRMAEISRLARQSIGEHRKTLEDLAK
ncbi:MAG TPA: hypothetical protein VF398_09040 [bacterium]